MKRIILTLLISCLLIGGLLWALNNKVSTSFSGSIRLAGQSVYLDHPAGSSLLLLTPGITRDSIWLPVAGTQITVTGHHRMEPLNCIEVQTISQNDSLISIRDAEFVPLHTASSTYTVAASCIGCRLCERNCPVGAISMQGRKAVIDQSKCVECGVCISGNGRFRGCPVGAIHK